VKGKMAVDEPVTDEDWTSRCVARMVQLDPMLDPELARPVVDDMCSRARWRTMAPEDAAQTVFDIGKPKPGKTPL
jgi:hypothetical protein